MAIHPAALVDPQARISESAEIGPNCIIGAGVEIGARTRLMAHVYVEGRHANRRRQHLLSLFHHRSGVADLNDKEPASVPRDETDKSGEFVSRSDARLRAFAFVFQILRRHSDG